MKLKFKVTKILTILLAFAFITGCNMTEEQAIILAKETFETGVTLEPQQPNQETKLFSYFLPTPLEVEETNENNLILSNGNQLYLIFANPAEDALSKVNYEQEKASEETTILIDIKETEETFSYLIVSPIENDKYQVTVGSGGEKGTTITDIPNFKDSVEIILQIINSVTY